MTKTGKSVCCGSIVFALFAMMRNFIAVSNMLFYLMACVFFVLGTLMTYLFLDSKGRENRALGNTLWSVLPIVTLIVWMILFFINETDIAPEQSLDSKALIRNYFSFPLWFTITAVGVLICLFLLRNQPKDETRRIRTAIRVIISILFTLGTAVQFYAPNIFMDVQGGTYHSHAYTNSIINTCWLIPYSEHNQALYGHYGILFMPALKALHSILGIDNLTGIFLVSAIIAGVSILLFAWVLNYFAKNEIIFYLGIFSIGEYYFMLMQGGVFLQVHPHRMIFPIIMAALALWEYRKAKKYNVLAILLIALSIVWSTEVGLVIMVAFALYRWVQGIMDGKRFLPAKILKLLPQILFFIVVPFVISYIIVNGYNIAVGGELLDIKEFLFPLISERGYISDIELPLPDVTHAWIGTSILFLGTVWVAARPILFPRENENPKDRPFYFLLGVMSLGLMLYYINRPVEGSLFIIMYFMLIMQVIILQKAQNKYMAWKQNKEPIFAGQNTFVFLALRVITTLILFVMTFDSLYSMPKAWKASAETIWRRDELKAFAEQIYVEIPPDAVSFGEGVPELLSMVDRDTHLHTTEWSYRNMPFDTMKEIRYSIDDEKWLFCSQESLYYFQLECPGLTDHYNLHGMLEYDSRQFALWERIEE